MSKSIEVLRWGLVSERHSLQVGYCSVYFLGVIPFWGLPEFLLERFLFFGVCGLTACIWACSWCLMCAAFCPHLVPLMLLDVSSDPVGAIKNTHQLSSFPYRSGAHLPILASVSFPVEWQHCQGPQQQVTMLLIAPSPCQQPLLLPGSSHRLFGCFCFVSSS